MPARRARAPERTLIFDLSEVLVGGLFDIIPSLSKRLGISPEEAMSGLGDDSWLALMEGRSSEADYWRSVLEATRWPLVAEELGALARQAFGQVVPGMPALLERLRPYRMVMLSDHGREWMAFIDRKHPFLATINPRFLSFEMGQTKRLLGTFERVLRELACPAECCLFIDDLHHNVERATAAGMPALHFRSAEQLAADLATAGFELAAPP